MALYLEALTEKGEPVKLMLSPGKPVVLGRAMDADLSIPGDPYISRKQAEIQLGDGRLSVRRLSGASNPILYRGEEQNEFTISAGDRFVVGKTQFTLVPEATMVRLQTDSGADQRLSHTISEQDLYTMGGRSDRLRLLDLLELPEMLRSKPRNEFFVHLAALLRIATNARWSSITNEAGSVLAKDAADASVTSFTMSRSLAQVALKEAPRPTLYLWSKPTADLKATVSEGSDWAICAAMRLAGEPPVLLYVTGEGGESGESHQENARFVGLVADMVSRSLSVQKLEGMQGRLQQYFSGPVISKILESNDPKELEPRLAQATTMFFDLRGFSKRTEGQNDKILEHLNELRRVMTAMTEEIFKENGVVLQYLGDGIMACWNVPIADEEHVNRACRAALGMAATLARIGGGWTCGIGIHSGEVVAGSLGSEQMFSYTVMGSTVNQTSRVEGITKIVETPVLVTREVAAKVGAAVARTRRVGRFQPAGMRTALDLFELLPANAGEEPIATYGKGLDAFERGEWEESYEILDRLGTGDRPARYIKSLAEMFRRRPPRDWSGVIELTEK